MPDQADPIAETLPAGVVPDTSPVDTAPMEPGRARAIFSREDFKLLRTAVVHYLQEVKDSPDSIKYSNLYHRLGRLG